jgi:methionyl-tRNA formyltransferase
MLKIIFFGTPEFAAVSLRALLNCPSALLLAVYCQPDRPAGRGRLLRPGPVKTAALMHGLPVLQPLHFREQNELRRLAAFKAELFVVAAYGMILPGDLLRIPPLGTINAHASLLPGYRGAAPIQRAVMNGERITGVTIMRVEPKLDSGPILLQRQVTVGPDQNSGELHDELARLGGTLLAETLTLMCSSTEPMLGREQDESLATYAHKLSKADGILNFNGSVQQVHNQARGVTPWPGAQLCFTRQAIDGRDEKDLKPVPALVERGVILPPPLVPAFHSGLKPGALMPLQDNCLPVACADGFYGLARLKPAGGKSMDAASFVNGYLKNCIAGISPV